MNATIPRRSIRYALIVAIVGGAFYLTLTPTYLLHQLVSGVIGAIIPYLVFIRYRSSPRLSILWDVFNRPERAWLIVCTIGVAFSSFVTQSDAVLAILGSGSLVGLWVGAVVYGRTTLTEY